MKLVLQKFFNRFEKEYILVLKERHIYDKKRNSNYNNDLINDVVLIKEDITPRMKWRKAKVGGRCISLTTFFNLIGGIFD